MLFVRSPSKTKGLLVDDLKMRSFSQGFDVRKQMLRETASDWLSRSNLEQTHTQAHTHTHRHTHKQTHTGA